MPLQTEINQMGVNLNYHPFYANLGVTGDFNYGVNKNIYDDINFRMNRNKYGDNYSIGNDKLNLSYMPNKYNPMWMLNYNKQF